MIDTHCHLVSEKLRANVLEYVQAAKLNGIQKIINIAYNLETASVLKEQLNVSELLYGSLGIQPHDAHEYQNSILDDYKDMFRTNLRMVAIGEIGLDYHYTLSPVDQQKRCFADFLDLAIELKMPVVVHMRDSHDDVLSFIKYRPQLTGVIHCFTGTLEQAKSYLDCGFYLSFSGIITFKNSESLQQVVEYCPNDRILIETDSPYLAPVPFRGKVNEPAYVKHICQKVSEIRKCTFDDACNMTTRNAQSLFPRL